MNTIIVETIIEASAAPSDEELMAWQALTATERERCLAAAVEAGFESGVSGRGIDEIIADARARCLKPHG